MLTKSDLAAPRKLRAFYRPLAIPMLTTRQPLPAQTLTRLRKALDGRISVLIGQSGVGKSSLVNELVPDAGRAVGHVNAVTGKGRHTSSSAIALRSAWTRIPAGSSTPRECAASALATSPPTGSSRRSATWPREPRTARRAATTCPPGCALDEWAAEHDATARLESLRRLLRSRESAD